MVIVIRPDQDPYSGEIVIRPDQDPYGGEIVIRPDQDPYSGECSDPDLTRTLIVVR